MLTDYCLFFVRIFDKQVSCDSNNRGIERNIRSLPVENPVEDVDNYMKKKQGKGIM